MHTRAWTALCSFSLLGVGCGLYGLNGDENLVNIECVGEVPTLEELPFESLVRSQISEGSKSELSSRCGGNGNREQTFRFTPPQSGSYELRVLSDFDAVVYVIESPCDGAREAACVDQNGTFTSEVLTVDLIAGEAYAVVVDGYSTVSFGDFTIYATLLSGGSDSDSSDSEGPSADCSTVVNVLEPSWDGIRWSGTYQGSTLGTSDEFGSACGAASGSDEAWRFTPPEPGVYRATLNANGFQGLVSVRDPGCTEIACSDGGAASFPNPSTEVLLAAGEHTIVVDTFDGSTGAYQLVVEQILESELSETCRQTCSGPADCLDGEVCLGTLSGQVCLASLCESCFAADQTCSSYPYTCEPIGCF